MMIMQVGDVPPAAGPARKQFLLSSGTATLNAARVELSDGLRLLGASASLMPSVERIIRSDGSSCYSTGENEDWNSFKDTVPVFTVEAAAPHVRRAELLAVESLNYLEDTSQADECHELVHRTASLRAALVGCPMRLAEAHLWLDCPGRIAHMRMGASAGLTTSFVCSVCREPIEDCDHLPGLSYSVSMVRDGKGSCSICHESACGHEVGTVYELPATAMATDVIAHEVSMVSRPRYPLARIRRFGLPLEPGTEMYRAAESGVVHCSGCMEPCRGLQQMSASPDSMFDDLLYYRAPRFSGAADRGDDPENDRELSVALDAPA